MAGLDWLIAVLEKRNVQVQHIGTGSVRVALPVPHADGQTITYAINVSGHGNSLMAAEDESNHLLPRFCPDRHIEGDGAFCMYWEEEERFEVEDEETASRWLEILVSFLRNQLRAANLRRWPTSDWSHGEPAAKAQKHAEQAAGVLSEEWREMVVSRRLNIERERSGVFRVRLDDAFLYSTWLVPRRRNGLRSHALRVCEATSKTRRIVSKQKRALNLHQLAIALWAWHRAEERFWNAVATRPCCGTMETCGLRKNI